MVFSSSSSFGWKETELSFASGLSHSVYLVREKFSHSIDFVANSKDFKSRFYKLRRIVSSSLRSMTRRTRWWEWVVT